MVLTKRNSIRCVVILVAVFIIGEIGSRYFLGLGTPLLYMPHPRIEYMLKPNQNIHRLGKHFFVNQYGMRSEPFVGKKGGLRMMVFGDSVVNGGNSTDQKDLATSLLRNWIIKEGYKELVVGNISAGSWGPGNWLAYAKEYGFFDADIIILVISSHDYIDNPTFAPFANAHPIKRPVSALLYGFTRYFYPSLIKMITRNNIRKPVQPTNDMVTEAEAKKGLSDLKEFLRLAKKEAKNILVFQYLTQTEITSFTTMPGYQRIKDVCEESDIKPVSLEPYFRKSLEKGINPYQDDIHPNVSGQRNIAEAVMENLLMDAFLYKSI